MDEPERVWINHPACQYSSRNLWSRTEIGAGPNASKITEYLRKDLAIQIPPEGPERDELVDRMARAAAPRLWSTFDQSGDHQGVFMARAEIRHYIRAALQVLIGEK